MDSLAGRLLLMASCVWIKEVTHATTGWEYEADFSKCQIKSIEDFLPVTRWNPCFSCQCSNKTGIEECSIRRQQCPSIPCTLQIFNPKECCKTCRGCSYMGLSRQNMERWSEGCINFECHEGVITKSRTECIPACTHPIKDEGNCCPKCTGCSYKGQIISEGEVLLEKLDPCIRCTCTNGSLTCFRQACPFLHCESQVRNLGKCCGECKTGVPKFISWQETSCHILGVELRNDEEYRVDKCTTCFCRNGTILCAKEECVVDTSCNREDQVETAMHCCPVCKAKITCTFMGRTYQNSERWYLPGCAECQCLNGKNVCRRQTCRTPEPQCEQGFSLDFIPGACCRVCLPEKRSCITYGDPHYRTFDGKAFSYQGVCKYTLVQEVHGLFSISSRNTGRYTDRFSSVKSVILHYGNLTIALLQKLRVKVNSKVVQIPYLRYPDIDIRKSERYLFLYTNDGLSIKWDGDTYIEVSLIDFFQNKVKGLCGNFNDNPKDDFVLPNGMFAASAELFGDYWKEENARKCKRHVESPNRPHGASCEGWKLFHAHRACKVLFSDLSISSCRWKIATEIFFQDCVTDMCHCPTGKKHCECAVVRSYFDTCRKKIPTLQWHRREQCDSSCSGGSVFSACGPACAATCENYNDLAPCKRPCVAGCHCPAGLVWNQGVCVLPNLCADFRGEEEPHRLL